MPTLVEGALLCRIELEYRIANLAAGVKRNEGARTQSHAKSLTAREKVDYNAGVGTEVS